MSDADRLGVDLEVGQDSNGDAVVVAHQGEEKMLGVNRGAAQAQPRSVGALERVPRALGKRHLPRHWVSPRADDSHHLAAHTLGGHTERVQHLRGDALTLQHYAQEQVLSADVVVLEASRFSLA